MKLPFRQLLLDSEFYKTLKEEHAIYISNSSFSAIDDCFAKGLIQSLIRIEKKSSPVHLIFGSLVHKGLELLIIEEKNLKETLEFLRATEDYEKLKEVQYRNKTPENLEKALTQCYTDLKTELFFKPLYYDRQNSPLSEESFVVLLGTVSWNGIEIKVYWKGVIDLLAEYQDQPYILDHKTTSQLGPTFINNFERDNQILGYLTAINLLLKQTDSFPVHTKTNTLKFDLVKTPPKGAIIYAICPLTKEVKTKDFPLRYTQAQLDEWHEDILMQIENMLNVDLERFLKTEHVLPKRTSCSHKYGLCPFYDLCEMPVNQRLAMLKSDLFQVRSTGKV